MTTETPDSVAVPEKSILLPIDTKMRSVLSVGGGACACGRGLLAGDDVFLDLITGSFVCSPCGKVLRYHRKKAAQRGETMPPTLSDVRSL